MNKRHTIVLISLMLFASGAFAGLIPSFDTKLPLGPEDPSPVLAGIGGAGVAVAYLRSKFRNNKKVGK